MTPITYCNLQQSNSMHEFRKKYLPQLVSSEQLVSIYCMFKFISTKEYLKKSN